jgi:hypothetical protein
MWRDVAFMVCVCSVAAGDTLIVAPSGAAYTSIQTALNDAMAGDDVLVRSGTYNEAIVFPRDGTQGAWIALQAWPGELPVIDGGGVSSPYLVTIEDRHWVRVDGFEIRNNLNVPGEGAGVRVLGTGSNIEILNCDIHDMRGTSAMGIMVYGTSVVESISDLVIDGNVVHDCEPAPSEAITLNGNVERFAVTNNIVRDVNNIGIDFIGGETTINPQFVARDGVCRGNRVVNANSNYGGGWAGGIYVDGGRDIAIDANVVTGCDIGIEIGAENAGWVTSGIVVSNNIVVGNDKVGIVFGGYEAAAGRVEDSIFVNNTCYQNDRLHEGLGELWVQHANDCVVANNIFQSHGHHVLLYNDSPASGITMAWNQWYATGQPDFTWDSVSYGSLGDFAVGTGFGQGAMFGSPQFVSPTGADAVLGTEDDDFSLMLGSPCIDAASTVLLPSDVLWDHASRPRRVDHPDVTDSGQGASPLPDKGAREVQVCAGDTDGDGQVNQSDVLAVIDAWGEVSSVADVNESGQVDVVDLLVVLDQFGPC